MKNIVSNILKAGSQIFGSVDIALDIGTSMTRIGVAGRGIVLREPTYVGQNQKTGESLFFGREAREIWGKAPNFIEVIKPIQDSIIADFDACSTLIKTFLKKSVDPYFIRGRILKPRLAGTTTVPTSATEVQQKAIQEALIKAGITDVALIEKPIASALGAGLPVFSHRPSFVIDMGGGIIELCVIISGGIVASKTFKNAGEHMDRLIQNYVHLKYGVIIGEQTAERLKTTLYTLNEKNDVVPIRGKSLETSLPKSVRVKSADIREALGANLNQIVDAAKELIESIPPEVIDGIIKRGVMMTGALARIEAIDRFMTSELKIPVLVGDNPQDATATGLLRLLQDRQRIERVRIA